MAGVNVSTNRYATSNIIVAPTIAEGAMFTTIASALTYAAANSLTDIFIKPGTYTENFTLPAGINLVSNANDEYIPTVTIVGKITMTAAGTSTIAGIRLQTNSDFCISVTGSSASALHLENCYVNCTNNTGIQFTSSSSSANISLYNCITATTTTGIALYTHSSAGSLSFVKCNVRNGGATTTASNNSAGLVFVFDSLFSTPISTSSTGLFTGYYSYFSAGSNTTVITHNSTNATNGLTYCYVFAGSQVGIALGAGSTFQMSNSTVDSTNTNAISGSGGLTYDTINFIGTSSTIQGTVTLAKRAQITGAVTANTSVTSPTIAATTTLTTPSLTINSGTAITTYVEGTFSPTVQTSNGNMSGISYGIQVGKYVKIGNFVTVNVFMQWSNSGAGTGNVIINNLPYTIQNTTNYYSVGSLIVQNITTPASGVWGQTLPLPNTTTAQFQYTVSAGTWTQVSTTTFTNGTVSFTITYRAA